VTEAASSPKRRPDPRPDRNRAAALAAGRELLAERGWDAVTHLAVAEHSGLGRSSLYRYWPDPGDLLHDVIESELPSSTLVPTGDLRADLVDEMWRLAQRINDPRSARMILTVVERAATDPIFGQLRDLWHLEGTRATRDIIRCSIAQGRLPDDLPIQDAIDQIAGPLITHGFFAGQPLTKEYVEASVDRFLHQFGR